MSYSKPFMSCLDIYKKHFGLKFIKQFSNSEFCKAANTVLGSSVIPNRYGENYFKGDILVYLFHPQIGIVMENIAGALDEVRKDVEAAQDVLQQSFNELLKTHNLLAPQIVKMSKELRDKRRALTTEIKLSLSLFKDIRAFFMEKDHKEEIERTTQFLDVCERMKALIDNGTMDAITETILKLEGVKNNGQTKKGDREGS